MQNIYAMDTSLPFSRKCKHFVLMKHFLLTRCQNYFPCFTSFPFFCYVAPFKKHKRCEVQARSLFCLSFNFSADRL